LIHACHNRTVVIDAHLGERENKQVNVVEAHGLRNVHLYEDDAAARSAMIPPSETRQLRVSC
jgi:hypothetical protein